MLTLFANFDYSVFWYTYSTIAQTLATSFAFLVAVALYRIQSLTNNFGYQASNIRNVANDVFRNQDLSAKIDDDIRHGWWDDVVEKTEEFLNLPVVNPVNHEHVKELFHHFKIDVGSVQMIKKGLKECLNLTAFSIVLCLFFMPVTVKEIANPFAGYVMLTLTVGSSCVCLSKFVEFATSITARDSSKQ